MSSMQEAEEKKSPAAESSQSETLSSAGVARRTQTQMAIRQLRGNYGAILGISLLLVIGLVAIFAWQIMPASPYEYESALRRSGPSTDAWLGRDELGRDILSRIILGARIAFGVALVAVAIGLIIGTLLGVLAAYAGGKVDTTLSLVIDALLAFPTLLLAIIIIAALGPGLRNTAIAIGVSAIPVYARIARGSALSVSRNDYVEAARALGAQAPRILGIHILPNIISPLTVISTIMLARAILSEAGLSFLGLGAQPPEPSWGSMAATGRAFLQSDPHIVLVPGLAIMLTVLAFNLFGDGLRDALDPRLRTSTSD